MSVFHDPYRTYEITIRIKADSVAKVLSALGALVRQIAVHQYEEHLGVNRMIGEFGWDVWMDVKIDDKGRPEQG
jgi:hypothetical protein